MIEASSCWTRKILGSSPTNKTFLRIYSEILWEFILRSWNVKTDNSNSFLGSNILNDQLYFLQCAIWVFHLSVWLDWFLHRRLSAQIRLSTKIMLSNMVMDSSKAPHQDLARYFSCFSSIFRVSFRIYIKPMIVWNAAIFA